MITNIDPKYRPLDADSELFLYNFDEPSDSYIVEVGANEEYVANILTDNGHHVVGIDLRRYLQEIPCNYHRLEGDFNDLANDLGDVDCVVSLSAIEHFGLTTYGDTYNALPYYDVVAMRKIWEILKPEGVCYLTVPYGKDFLTCGKHWRVYNHSSLYARLVQKFVVEEKIFFTSGDATIDFEKRQSYKPVTEEEANRFCGTPPHITVLLKLRKMDLANLQYERIKHNTREKEHVG